MSTLREFLNDKGFNWASGRIIVQQCDEDESPGWASPKSAFVVEHDDGVLDKEFYAGYGGPNCPRYIAEDSEAYYFPSQYDGSTNPEKVLKDINRYMDITNETPYPGG